MNKFKAEITANEPVATAIFNLRFHCPELAASAKPGQFLEALCPGQEGPFLRRPFGIHRVNKKSGVCEILFRKAGRGTALLSALKVGDALDFVAPLGNGFSLQKGKTQIIAGGGMGIAPLLCLAEALFAAGEKNHLFLAAKTAADLPRLDIYGKLGTLHLSTEDGSAGEKGLINAPLERFLKDCSDPVLYACGPHPMLRCVAGLAEKHTIAAQVSLEEKMACGIGVCQGCPVEVKNKDTRYKMVCKDGPVFNAEDIVW